MKHLRLCGILRTAAFLLIFSFLFNSAAGILRSKNYASASAAFYEEPEGTVDVLLMGSSHMLNAVSPVQLWAEYGIASNNLAQNGQVLPVTYYALQEALRYQKPELVVLDVYKVVQDSLIDSKASLHYTLDNMSFGLPKLRAIFELLEPEDRAEYLLDIILYHTRWKELTEEDFQKPDTTEKGAQALFTTARPYEGWTVLPESETAPPAEVEIAYLERIVELCRQEGIELLLTAAPFTTPEDDDLNRQAAVNAVTGYAEAWGVPFVNLMHRTEEMDFDFSTDMADTYHVNWRGMEKVTAWLGDYLEGHYSLPDHREEASYSRWDEAVPVWRDWMDSQLAAAGAEAGTGAK